MSFGVENASRLRRQYRPGDEVIVETSVNGHPACLKGIIESGPQVDMYGGNYYVVYLENGVIQNVQTSDLVPYSEFALFACRQRAKEGFPDTDRSLDDQIVPMVILLLLVGATVAWGWAKFGKRRPALA